MGRQVVFSCQQTGFSSWTIHLPSRGQITRTITQQDTEVTFQGDPGFGFTILIIPSSSGIHSELHVTAVRQLNGVLVECTGGRGLMSYTIQISSEGQSSYVIASTLLHS